MPPHKCFEFWDDWDVRERDAHRTASKMLALRQEIMEIVFLAFILILTIFLGFELINKVPATLHTPLMSGSNAISGITLIGALVSAGSGESQTASILGILAVVLATVNVIGGYLVTDRMLGMFKKKSRNGER